MCDAHLGRAYVAELAKVMPTREAPSTGTPEHARLLELVASMRRLLAIFLAEHMTTMRELRKCANPHLRAATLATPSDTIAVASQTGLCNDVARAWTDDYVGFNPSVTLHGRRRNQCWRRARPLSRMQTWSAEPVFPCKHPCSWDLMLPHVLLTRSVNTEKVTPDMSTNSEASSQDLAEIGSAPGSVIGKRETVSWRQAADCVRLTVAQAAAVVEARTTAGARLTECVSKQRLRW